MGDTSPRFRQDLLAVAADADGVACVDVEDPNSGTRFRFYDFEYAMATQMDGRPVADIVAWAAETYGLDLTEDGVRSFAQQLEGMGFLEAPGSTFAAPPDETAFDGFEAPVTADDGAPPVSRLVNDAVSQVTALPTAPVDDATSRSAYGDFSFGGAAAGDETTADAEWSSQDGDRTVNAPALEQLEADLAFRSRHAPSPSPESPNEFNDSEQTGHWVPPFGTDHPRDPGKWAESLNETLQGNGAAGAIAPAAAGPPTGETLHGFGAAGPWRGPPLEPPGRGSPRASRPVPPPLAGLPLTPPPGPLTPPPVQERPHFELSATPPPMAPAPSPAPSLGSAPLPVTFERRQPPPPEQVVMAPFQPAPIDPGPSRQFRAPLEPPPPGRGPRVAVLIMLLLAAAGGAVYYLWTTGMLGGGTVPHVRVLSPQPATVYRWFEPTGRVIASEVRAVGFTSGGHVTDVLPSGSTFVAGEIIARLQGAAAVESDVSRLRARQLFYEQLRDSMEAAGNPAEARQAELKLKEKARLVAEAQAVLATRVIRATEPGEVIEALVNAGTTVAADAPAVKVSPGRLRASFALGPADTAVAAQMRFCRVEVVGQAPTASIADSRAGAAGGSAADSVPTSAGGSARFVECEGVAPAGSPPPPSEGAAGSRPFVVTLPTGAGVAVGQPVRLARARFDGVFVLPRAAVGRGVPGVDRVLVATAAGVAEVRAVIVADIAGDEALVSRGLEVGEPVIVDAPADLHDDTPIVVDR